uniref:RBR-type E3 ubiquitin transferase n=1 Tax=Lygus hesperus TaxID=30085 RepID=A0A0A9Z9G3_LYGHE
MELWDKYNLILRKIFTEERSTLMPCRNPGCNYIIWGYSNTKSVQCICKQTGCFQCKNTEAHDPLDCTMYHRWQEQCRKDLQSVEWMFANTKKCPKCFVRIEKNSGCNHMTCIHCNYQFCWVCNGSWKQHEEDAKGSLNPFHCNWYTVRRDSGDSNPSTVTTDTGAKVVDTTASLQTQKYLFYFTRYYNQEMNKNFLINKRHYIHTVTQKIIHAQRYTVPPYLETVLVLANEELIIARRILQYSYAYGFFLTDQQQRTLLEYQQGRLESLTDSLVTSIYRIDVQTVQLTTIHSQFQLLHTTIVHFLDTLSDRSYQLSPPSTAVVHSHR